MLSPEGNHVATNLKYLLASNSVPVIVWQLNFVTPCTRCTTLDRMMIPSIQRAQAHVVILVGVDLVPPVPRSIYRPRNRRSTV